MKWRWRLWLASFALAAVLLCNSEAQALAIGRACATAPADLSRFAAELSAHRVNAVRHRVAIIVGNSDYTLAANGAPPLANAAADARLVADASAHAGYFTLCFLNLTREQFDAVTSFVQENPPGSALPDQPNEFRHLFFYFAGHGFSYERQTYILPMSYTATGGSAISSAIALDGLLTRLRENGDVVVAAIDACRSRPPSLASSDTRTAAPTLKDGPTASTSTGFIVQYASAEGYLSSDVGPQQGYGPYAPSFAQSGEVPGLSLLILMGVVQAQTKRATRQEPHISASPAASERVFFPHDGSRPYRLFAAAWSNAYLHNDPCESADISLPQLEAHPLVNPDSRTQARWEELVTRLRQCANGERSTASLVLESTDTTVALNTHTSVVRLPSVSTQFVWSEMLSRSRDALTVSANYADGFISGDPTNPRAFRLANTEFQQVVQGELVDSISQFQTRQSVRGRIVAFRLAPRTDDEALQLMETQVELDTHNLSQGQPLATVRPVARGSAIARVLGSGDSTVLVDQTALINAIARR